jgi:hypothetical protein
MDPAVLGEIAERCGIHISTAHGWRTRFLERLVDDQPELLGIAEVDETMLRRSAKGQPKVGEELRRPPRKRGGGSGSGGTNPICWYATSSHVQRLDQHETQKAPEYIMSPPDAAASSPDLNRSSVAP